MTKLNGFIPAAAMLLAGAFACGAISITASAQGMSEQAPAVGKGPAADKGAGREAFVPKEGQEGKDVIWLPTAQALVDRMLDMA
ncbi:MAG: hypothetical protein AB7G35_14850, partial [Hyphomicrobiaceae bacterium]